MTATPFARPLYVMAKPAGAACNLSCRYCYYLAKSKLYHEPQPHAMSDSLLDTFTRQYIEAQTQPEVLFTWHGGEPLLRPISFYRKALRLQQLYAHGRTVDNCLQTNGTLLNDEWCLFFKHNNFLIGISIDGPQTQHDAYRLTPDGQTSWLRVMQGIDMLNRHGVQWNAMATVNRLNADHPREFYNFFRSIGCQYLQFTPVVEHHNDGSPLPYSVTPEQWGEFTCGVYDEWVKADVGTVFVQLFDATLANWAGVTPGVCSLSQMCGHSMAMEWNGDVYACDHFVFPEYKLGNIRQLTLTAMAYGERLEAFRRMKNGSLPRQCRECQWLFACHGECPKNRFCTDNYGEPYLNYLCQGYRQFFQHVAADMDFMTAELDAGRPPANVMKFRRKEHFL